MAHAEREETKENIETEREKERKRELEALKEEAKRCYMPVCARETEREREHERHNNRQRELRSLIYVCKILVHLCA